VGVLSSFDHKGDSFHNPDREKHAFRVAFISYVILTDSIVFLFTGYILGNDFGIVTDLDNFFRFHTDTTVVLTVFLFLNVGAFFTGLALATERTPKIQSYIAASDNLDNVKILNGKVTGLIFVPEICQQYSMIDIKKISSNKLELCDLKIGSKYANDTKAKWFEKGKTDHMAWFNTELGNLPCKIPEDLPVCVINFRGVGSVEFYNIPISTNYLITVAY